VTYKSWGQYEVRMLLRQVEIFDLVYPSAERKGVRSSMKGDEIEAEQMAKWKATTTGKYSVSLPAADVRLLHECGALKSSAD
jgi:hypothetical protein